MHLNFTLRELFRLASVHTAVLSLAVNITPPPMVALVPLAPRDKLRIGYLGYGLHAHPVGSFRLAFTFTQLCRSHDIRHSREAQPLAF